jgi:hypothetical protein
MKHNKGSENGVFDCRASILGGLIVLLATGPTTLAVTDYMFYSVNADTTATSMTQGDLLAWGANCGIGDSLSWEIWYDVDADSVIDLTGDVQITTFVAVDGGISPDEGLPDVSPIPDGWYITPTLILGVAPGQYIFKAVNLTDSSSVQKPLICLALLSPPNTFSGRLIVPGHSAPDSATLQYRWVEAEVENEELQIWAAMTNDSGLFTINIDSVGTGLTLRVGPPDIPGFVTPSPQMHVATGHIVDIDFEYSAPVDSIWGYLVDENDSVIMQPTWVWCGPRFGSGGKDVRTQNGRYVVLFGAMELGEWTAGASGDGLIPAYMQPVNFDFENTGDGTRHDFICPTANTVLYAEVTENGGPPAHRYRVEARHQYSGVSTYAISDTGFDNLVTLHITQLYSSDWEVSISIYSDEYPIPEGFTFDGNVWGLHPGETAYLNLSRGNMICDTLKCDPADPPVVWDSVTVAVYGWMAPNYYGLPDSNGVFTFYVEDGDYTLSVSCPGYFVNTGGVSLGWIDHDTVGGMGIELNRAHCRVHGMLSGVPLPLSGDFWIHAQGDTLHPGYYCNALVKPSTGAYEMDLCDGDWIIFPPYIPDYLIPDMVSLTIGNAPDTDRVLDFTYTGTVDAGDPTTRPAAFALFQNYPNPFNPTTLLQFGLPTAAHVRVEVFDILGRRVRTLMDETREAGLHSLTWDGHDDYGRQVGSGVYLYRLRTREYAETRKMLLMK